MNTPHTDRLQAMREHVEEQVRQRQAQRTDSEESLLPQATLRTLHELRVHQIELEMQNEALRHLQLEIEAQRTRYFNLYDLAPVGYCVVSEDGLILEANRTAAALLGVEPGLLVRQPLQHFVYGADHVRYGLARQQLLATGQAHQCELQMLRQGGQLFWAKLICSPAPDGSAAPVLHVALNDISERKRAEVALVEVQGELMAAQGAAHLGNWHWNLETDVHTWSPEVFLVYGHPMELGAVPYPAVRKYFTAESWLTLSAAVERCRSEGAAYDCEIELLRAEGERRWVSIFGNAVKDAQGRVSSLHGTLQDITERKRISEALSASESRFKKIFNEAPLGIALIDSLTGEILSVNSMFARIAGRSVLQMQQIDWMSLTHPDDVQKDLDQMARLNAGAITGYQMEKRYLHPDGSPVWISMTISPVQVDDGAAPCHLCMIEDISQRKQIEQELKVGEERFRLLFDRATDGIVILSEQGKLLNVNAAFARMHGYTPEELAALHLRDLDTPETAQGLSERLARICAGEALTFEVTHYRKDGRLLVLEVSSSLVVADGQRVIQAFHRDITERRRADELVRELAYYDPLTHLANRMLLKDRLIQSMLASQRSGNYGALMFLDLDNFKPLNDQHGHGVGDLLLAEVARRLKSCVRQIDTVARFGGDEFVVLLEDLTSDKQQARSQADLVAEKIRSLLFSPYVLRAAAGEDGTPQRVEHHCSTSIGVALFLAQESTQESVLIAADLAMYRAKDMGGNTVCFFDAQMQLEHVTQTALRRDLRNAIREQQFCLYYQPQLDGQGEITGVEALLRWRHPSRGWVEPTEFIATAEKTGLILPLGLWALETACKQLALWAAQPEMAHLTMAVNVSARQFRDKDFIEHVLSTVARTGANPYQLKLELTESFLVTNLEDVVRKMSLARAEGIGFALDDFGTGYSSLNFLKRLPLEQLKIDKSFVQNILIDQDDTAITRMVIDLARHMGLGVIAEGVETQAQRSFLAQMGCDHYQGHLFSPPLPIQDFEALLMRV